MATLENLLNAPDFSSCELGAMAHDGEVFRCAVYWIASDVALTELIKAKSVVDQHQDHFAPAGLSALWIYGYVKEPQTHSLAMKTRRRPSDGLTHSCQVRDLGDLTEKISRIGDVECLSLDEAFIEVLKDPSIPHNTISELLNIVDQTNPSLIEKSNDFVHNAQRVPYTELMKARLSGYPSLTR